MVTETIIVIKKNKFRKVGILATDGTIKTEIYTQALSNTTWVIPEKQDQENIMRIIYEIKAGLPLNKSLLFDICENLVLKGAECILLGCTELSLSYEAIAPYFSTIDSLRVLAQSLVNYSTPHKQEAFYLKNMSKNTLKTHSEPAGLELPDGSPNPLPDQADIRHTKQGVEDRLLSGRKRVDFSPDKGRRRGV
jgi:glutamate racemase